MFGRVMLACVTVAVLSIPTVVSSPAASNATPSSAAQLNVAPSTQSVADQTATARARFAQVAMGMLAALPVEPEVTSVPYDRDNFGDWIDADRDGCNTRREVLQLESLDPVSVTGRCTITSGEWVSFFDGRNSESAATLDIDHMVPLKEAWVSGAYEWSYTTLRSYANDLGYEHSLIAVTASSNRSKSDQDPASWLPTDASFMCQYLGRWVGVKYRWDLSVDEVERQVLSTEIERCGADAEVTQPERAAIVLATSAAGPSMSESAAAGVTAFANCAALNAVYPGGVANSSGAVNVANGRITPTRWPVTVYPELYAQHTRLDRDKDGIACER